MWVGNKRLLINPIARLREQAVQIAAHHERLGESIPEPKVKELRDLVSAFNRMSAELRTTYDELEQRVKERTEALSKTNQQLTEEINERTKAEEALRVSEERLRLFIEHAPAALAMFDRDMKYLAFSRRWSTDFQLGDQDLLGRSHYEIFPDIPERWKVAHRRGLEGEVVAADEDLFERYDGSRQWERWEVRPWHAGDGSVGGIVIFSEDITDRKQAEEALKKSEERLRLAQDAAQAGTWEWDLTTNENFWSDELWTLYGLEPRSCAPSYAAWLETVHPDDRAEVASAINEAASQGIELNAEWRTKEGKRWLMSRGRTLLDASGQVVRYIGIVVDITDRKVAEKLILESEKNHRLLIENLNAGVVVHGPDTTILLCNRVAAGILGLSQDEMTGKTARDSAWSFVREDRSPMPPDEYPVNRVIATLEPLENVLLGINRGRTRDRIWTLVNAYPELNEKKELVQVVVTFVDITDRKRAEVALAESEKKFRLLYEEAPIPYQSLDEEGHFLEVNPTWLQLTGYSHDEVIGKNFADFLSPKSQDRLRETFPAFKRAGEVYGVEHEMVRKDGSIIDVSIDGRVSRSEDGLFRRTHCVFQDVTQRKKAEAALRESEQRYRAVIDNLHIGISVLNPAMEIVAVNHFFRKRYPHVRPGTGQLCHKVYNDPPKNAICEYCPCVRTFRDGMVHECITETPAGNKIRNYKIVSCPIKDSEGKVEFVIELTEDITETRDLQLQLAQAQKMEAIGTLAGGVAHDFNNLLQVVLGYSELMLDDHHFPQKYSDDMHKVAQAAKNGADLVRRLLTFSRKTEYNPRPLNLNRLIEQLQKMISRTIPKMVAIELILAPNLSNINADPTQVDQILMNLSVNARDAMPDGGRLVIETENVILDENYSKVHLEAKVGPHVVLKVSDTGQGMDKSVLSHIFEPFYTTKEAGKGTGLGLAMVYGMVKQHGGHITCYSEPDRGTTFKIYFPAIVSRIEQRQTKTDLMPKGGSETILLVEDEAHIRDLGSRMLTKVGYTVLTASNGKEALEIYKRRSHEIDLVVLDLIMPEMGGKQCLEQLVKLNPNVKVVIASGFSPNGQIKEVLGSGAQGFVGKPYDMRTVLEVVRDVLDKK